jgi:feruloyl esterase
LLVGTNPTAWAEGGPPEASACSGLRTAQIADTEITAAERVSGTTFKLPSDWDPALNAYLRDLPTFCRVVGVIRPTSDSAIGFELWLPDQWNGRYLQVGNVGFAGTIIDSGLIQGLQNGFAVSGTDDGHAGNGTDWMTGHPEKVVDFGYRAVHSTSVSAKAIATKYYRQRIPLSYFSGCSSGGREGLMEAQRYPDDFDGWLVGAPSIDWVSLMVFHLYKAQMTAALKEPLTHKQLASLSAAVLSRCDAMDGTKDGLIDNPLRCTFDPKELQCTGAADGQCLSPVQVELARTIYDDVRESAGGASLMPGLQGTRGVEASSWQFPEISPNTSTDDFYGQMLHGFWPKLVFNNPKLDYRTLNLLDALKTGDSRVASTINAVNPNLSAIRASGKKVIQYHGWADSAVPAQYSIRYYEAVKKYLGHDNQDFYRLFMVPGMEHCFAGPGPNVFGGAYTPGGIFDADHHALAALMQWVETGKAPEQIIATKYQDDDTSKAIIRTRPLCPYPRVAHWTGKGSNGDAGNFTCSANGIASETMGRTK